MVKLPLWKVLQTKPGMLECDCIFNCVEELEVGLLEYVLEELPIDEVVHALNTVILSVLPVHFASFCSLVLSSMYGFNQLATLNVIIQ